jgi:hypothetical protein
VAGKASSRAAIEPLGLTAEEIAAQPENTAREVFSFLDIPLEGVRFEVRTSRQADAINEGWIARFESEPG